MGSVRCGPVDKQRCGSVDGQACKFVDGQACGGVNTQDRHGWRAHFSLRAPRATWKSIKCKQSDRGAFTMAAMKIGVVGAGLMGHGIAYLLAAAGHTVAIYDPSAEWRDSLPARLASARELLGGDPALLDRISAHDRMAPAMKDASFVFRGCAGNACAEAVDFRRA
jgi:hypothetical protein